MKAIATTMIIGALFLGARSGIAAGWSSTSHLAYTVMGSSSTGFGNAAGSALFFDLQRRLGSKWQVGLRTSAIGAQSEAGELYRLVAGPVARMTFAKSWAIQLSAGMFNESATDSGEEVYKSRGQSIQFGWERVAVLSKVVHVSWGGFLGKHWGNMSESRTSTVASSTNIGDYRGVQIALRIML